MRKIRAGIVLLLALMTAMAVAGCGTTTTTTVGTSSNGVTIHTKSVTINGAQMTVLADASNKTLYYFTADTAQTVACSASCASLWPPLLSPGGTPTSANALSGTLAVQNDANGAQATYKGHPLYTYSKDQTASDATGQGLFGKWFVATPDVTPLAGAPAAPTATSSGGSGY